MNLNCYTQAKTRRMNEFNFYHNDIIGWGTQGNAVYIKKRRHANYIIGILAI